MPFPSEPIPGSLRILFMGTPAFAVPALQGLLEGGEELVQVVTQPDRPKGRSRRPIPPPVKELALKRGVEVSQPDTIRSEEFLSATRSLEPDLIIVAAFGKIISRDLLQIPRFGCINIHASLLPKYRGAAPIQWAIINGEKETGITTMLMDAGLDTGEILLKKKLEIGEEETAGELYNRLAEAGKEALLETLRDLKRGVLTPEPQDHSQATLAPPLKAEDARIPWSKPARQIFNRIRGMNPRPGAYAYLGKARLKIFKSAPLEEPAFEEPGTVVDAGSTLLTVAAGKGRLSLKEIQLEGGKRMKVSEFLRGHRIAPGERFS